MIPATIFNKNTNLGATIVDFMAILQSTDYSKFERFFKVADKISA